MKTTRALCMVAAALAMAGGAAAAPPVAKRALTVGPVYDIKEPSIYVQLQQLLDQKKANGELAELERQGRERAERTIRMPEPVPGLFVAKQKRAWTYDPSVVATTDIRDQDGNLVVARGTAVSPLTQASWRPMVFFDQRDEAQVAYAKRVMKEWNGRGKAVLVGGDWIALTKSWKQQVYFDQKAILIQRFNISAVPATVVQRGNVLQVTEIPSDSKESQ